MDNELNKMPLISEWVVYVYNKQAFKTICNGAKKDFHAKPYFEICRLKTVNDAIFFVKLMSEIIEPENNIRVMDKRDYIIMRNGITPIWEDPANINGGIYSVIVSHQNGNRIWMDFFLSIVGETLSKNMSSINGMSYSHITSNNNFNMNFPPKQKSNSTYIKIWDGKEGNDLASFQGSLSQEIINHVKNESAIYTPHKNKKDFKNDGTIYDRLKSSNAVGGGNKYGRPGAKSYNR